MSELIFIFCVIFSAPAFVVALALTALNHAIVTRNPFKIFWHFLWAAIWVVPVTFITFTSLIVIAFFPEIRPYAAIFLCLLNAVETVIIFRRLGKPDSFVGSFFHVLPIVTALASGWLVFTSPLGRT